MKLKYLVLVLIAIAMLGLNSAEASIPLIPVITTVPGQNGTTITSTTVGGVLITQIITFSNGNTLEYQLINGVWMMVNGPFQIPEPTYILKY